MLCFEQELLWSWYLFTATEQILRQKLVLGAGYFCNRPDHATVGKIWTLELQIRKANGLLFPTSHVSGFLYLLLGEDISHTTCSNY